MFNFLKTDDPYLGNGTFGQLARFGPERCAVMHLQLMDLENGGWMKKKEFDRYNSAYAESDPAVKEFLDNATTVFFQRYRYIFNKHLVKKWTSTEVVHYLLGGDPHHAKEFARWLVYHKTKHDSKKGTSTTHMQTRSNSSTPVSARSTPATPTSSKSINSESTNSLNGEEMEFIFEKKEVTLGKHHKMTHGDVKIDLHESMNFITENADPSLILKDPFITQNWAYINSLANEKIAVDTWAETTPNNKKYAPFVVNIIHSICIHSSHQQRCENYVQLCGLLSSTGVGEVRRTCRAIMNSIINRRFNLWVLQTTNQRRKSAGVREIKRLQGHEKVALFAEFTNSFFAKVDNAMGSREVWKKIRSRLESTSGKASECEKAELLEKFCKCAKENPKYVKAHRPMGIELTARTAKAVSLGVLVAVNNSFLKGSGFAIEDIVDDEVAARGIKLAVDPKRKSTLQNKRQAIRKHEWLRRVAAGQQDLKEVDVDSILPVSKRMKQFLDSGFHADILDGEKKMEMLDIEDLNA